MQKLIFSLIFVMFTLSAHAYIGPGMGGGIIAATIGVVVAIFAAMTASVASSEDPIAPAAISPAAITSP